MHKKLGYSILFLGIFIWFLQDSQLLINCMTNVFQLYCIILAQTISFGSLNLILLDPILIWNNLISKQDQKTWNTGAETYSLGWVVKSKKLNYFDFLIFNHVHFTLKVTLFFDQPVNISLKFIFLVLIFYNDYFWCLL